MFLLSVFTLNSINVILWWLSEALLKGKLDINKAFICRWSLWETWSASTALWVALFWMNVSRGPVREHLAIQLWVREFYILLCGKEFCLVFLLPFFWEASFRWSYFLSFPSGDCSHLQCSEDWSLTGPTATTAFLFASLVMALCLVLVSCLPDCPAERTF